MKTFNLNGMLPATILPMTADYQPDFEAYGGYIEWLIAEGAIALAVNMDTGEGPQLSVEERRRVVETAVKVSNGRCPVVAGVMGSTTDDAVKMANVNIDAGADGLVVFPNAGFRNEPLDLRIPYNYHKAIATETGLPMILFQLAPVFGGANYTRETLLRLLEIPEVVAIKEASFDSQYFAYTKETLDIAERDIMLLTGNDRFITESILLGATGALLGFGAIGCKMVADMLRAANSGDWQSVIKMRPKLHAFAMFIYQDPILDYRARCKSALAHVGVLDRSQTYVRPPLLSIDDEEYAAIGEALINAGMLIRQPAR